MAQYPSKIKNIVDLIAASRKPLDTEDIILYTPQWLASKLSSF